MRQQRTHLSSFVPITFIKNSWGCFHHLINPVLIICYCVTNHTQPRSIKQQPFCYTHRLILWGQEFKQCGVITAFSLLHNVWGLSWEALNAWK